MSGAVRAWLAPEGNLGTSDKERRSKLPVGGTVKLSCPSTTSLV